MRDRPILERGGILSHVGEEFQGMPHQIDAQSRDAAAWRAWARWPNLRHAARGGAAFGAGVGVVSLLIVDLRRVLTHTITTGNPIRMFVVGSLLIASSAAVWGLLSLSIAAVIRLVRRAFLLSHAPRAGESKRH